MPENFIVKGTDTPNWVSGIKVTARDGYKYEILVTTDRKQARIYHEEDLPFWQRHRSYQVVEIGQDEIMARLGQPQLPGLEDAL